MVFMDTEKLIFPVGTNFHPLFQNLSNPSLEKIYILIIEIFKTREQLKCF